MKKGILFFLLVCFAFASCGKKDDSGKKTNIKDKLIITYTNDYQNNFAAVMTSTKDSALKSAVDFNIRHQTIPDWELKECKEKVANYPCRIIPHDDSTKEINVFLPNNIILLAEGDADKEMGSPEWNDIEKLKATIPEFDIDGLLKLSGDTIKGTELLKYFPKLDKKQ